MRRNARAWCLALLALVAGGARGEELDWVLCSGEVEEVWMFLETHEGTMLAGGRGLHRCVSGCDWVGVDLLPRSAVVGFCQVSEGTIYAAGVRQDTRIPRAAVWRSDDDGATFDLTAEFIDADGESVIEAYRLSQGTDGFIYAATSSGVFRSNDGGATWLPTSNPSGSGYPPEIIGAVLGCSGGYVLANGGFSWVFRTDDGGQTWTRTKVSHGWMLADMIEAADGYVYLGGQAVHRSNDGGGTWEDVGSLDGFPAYDLLDGPDGHIYAAGWAGPVFRMDGPGNWTRVSPLWSGHAVGADSAGYLYADGDGYIYRTVEPVPEPGILALLVGGAIVLRRRAKAPI